MTYFRTGDPHYHRRYVVSRSCSGWEGVGPTRYDRQEFGGKVDFQVWPFSGSLSIFAGLYDLTMLTNID